MPVEGFRGGIELPAPIPFELRPQLDGSPPIQGPTPNKAVRPDGFDRLGLLRADGRPLSTGPFAALAQRGDFTGSVVTPSGEIEISVRIAGENAGHQRPMVFLDGLAARRERADRMAERFRNEAGRTVISILLKGQGETLLRDLEKNDGESVRDPIPDTEQAKVVVDVLDALGIKQPVDIFGLSYGGAIAAATARDAPDRIAHTLLVAPHVRSQARTSYGDGAWATMNSPWNPWGRQMYLAAARATLKSGFGVPPMFEKHPSKYIDALMALTMGIDGNELEDTTKGVKNVHILVAEDDGASPLRYNELAAEEAIGGSLTQAPDALKGQHDLLSAAPETVMEWVTATLNPDRLPQVKLSLAAAKAKQERLNEIQSFLAAAAQRFLDASKKAPVEAVKGAAEAAEAMAQGVKMAADAVPDHGADALALVGRALGLTKEAAEAAERFAEGQPTETMTKHLVRARRAAESAQNVADRVLRPRAA